MTQPTIADTCFELDGFSLLSVTGEDAARFLQGQLTCDIRTLGPTRASIAAFCNAKGRVISVLTLIERDGEFVLILPRSLLTKVYDKLRMYVLRSKVTLTPDPEHLQLVGLQIAAPDAHQPPLPTADFGVLQAGIIWVKLPGGQRYFGLLEQGKAAADDLQTCASGAMAEWRYLDISAGLPWFDEAQSEQHIPQTLNLDALGGISFEKGCYTGQEIIARTHYLGKAKRCLGLAECNADMTTHADLAILSASDAVRVGDIVAMQTHQQTCRLLVAFHSADDMAKCLILNDAANSPVRILPFQ